MTFEIQVNGHWVTVSEYIFRSWAGGRRITGLPYGTCEVKGPVYYLGTNKVSR